MQKFFSFIKPILLLMVESFFLSLIGVWIAYYLQYIIAPLQAFVDFLCGFGAGAGFALAFGHQFPNLKKYINIVLYTASVYFISCYCYAYSKITELTTQETIIRIIRFCIVLAVLILEYQLLCCCIRYLRSKVKRYCP